MIDILKSYLLQNWILMLILGAFVVIMLITSFFTKKTIIRLSILLFSIFILSIMVFMEFSVEQIASNPVARRIFISLRYSATPFIIALLNYVLVKHQKAFVFIPAGILLIVNIISIFTGIVFKVDADNNFSRGPVGFLPYVVCGLYMVFLIYILIKRSNKRAIEITPIVFLVVALSSGLIFPFVFGPDFSKIYCTIIIVSLFIYYVFSILQLAKKDSLTGLLNRQAYFVETRRSYKDITAIVSLDMNGLKKINDTYGHPAGDEALITLALCFARACKPKQSAYRMGGDEFLIVCRKTSKEEVIELIDRIKKYVADTEYTCSIGYSYHEEGTIKLEDLLKESDEKMYSDKADYYNRNR